VTADARENRPKMKFDNNRVFEYAISFPDGLLALGLGSDDSTIKTLELPADLMLVSWAEWLARLIERNGDEPVE